MSNFYTRPTENFPPAVRSLIMINVLVWVAQVLYDPRIATYDFITSKIGLWPIGSENFRFYQILTHMFAHGSYTGDIINGYDIYFVHILFNMFALWMFGRILENLWGSKRFLIFYLICGLGAAVFHLLVQYISGNGSIAVGASGAVYGVLVAFAVLFPNTELYLMFIPIPIKAKWAVLGLIVLYDIVFGFLITSGDGVAHAAHLGGALTGFILLKTWNKNNRRTLY